MKKWIVIEDGTLLNLDYIESIELERLGEEFTKRFLVQAHSDKHIYVIRRFKESVHAEEFMDDFYRKDLND